MAFEIIGSVIVAEALAAGTAEAVAASLVTGIAADAAVMGGAEALAESAVIGAGETAAGTVGGGLSDAQIAEIARASAQDSAEQLGYGNLTQSPPGSDAWLKQEIINRPELGKALEAGATASQIAQAAKLAQQGMSMADAMKLAGVAAPIIGSLLSSGAIKDASAAQQQATDAGIARINESTPVAQAAVTAAQQAGATGQNAALQTTLQRLTDANATGAAGERAAFETGAAGERAALDTATTNLKPYTDAGAGAIGQLALGTAPGGDLVRKFTTADLNADPVYQNGLQFGLDQGTAGINARALMAGNYDSGATLKALTRFGNDYGTTKAEGAYGRYTNDQNNVYSKLMGVSGVGQSATNAVNTLGFNTAQNIATQGNNTATTIAGQGNEMANRAGNYETGTAGSIANSGNVAATNNANIGIGANNNIVQLLTGMGNVRGAASIATGNNFSNAATGIGNTISNQSTLDKILAANRKVA